MRCRSDGQEPAAGFSLIEVLVVVAIIGLLVAVLMPGLGAARQRTRELSCGSNLRQLFLGVRYYSDAHGGKIPPFRSCGKPRTVDPDPKYLGWPDLVGRFIPTAGRDFGPGRETYREVHHCPEKRSNADEGDPAAPVEGSYGLNAYLCSFVTWTLNKPEVVFDWIVLDQLRRPTETVLIGESTRMVTVPSLPPAHGPVIARHRRCRFTNVAWADGHVTPEAAAEVADKKKCWDPGWYEGKSYTGGLP